MSVTRVVCIERRKGKEKGKSVGSKESQVDYVQTGVISKPGRVWTQIKQLRVSRVRTYSQPGSFTPGVSVSLRRKRW